MILDTVLELMQTEWKRPVPKWTTLAHIPHADMEFLGSECLKTSEFDPLQTRKKLFQRLLAGKAPFEVRRCKFGQVVAIYEQAEQKAEVPWDLWARILRCYYKRGGKPFKVFFLANRRLRVFPSRGAIEPTNINGGYTYACNHETIMIYRAEDATRVLLHELMHSCCLDDPEMDVDHVEAETEAWAELHHAAFLSKGNPAAFKRQIERQSAWMQTQNGMVKQFIKEPMDFPWRYTIGKEEVWQRWNILQPLFIIKEAQSSLRLTPPPDAATKRAFGVAMNSTML